MARGAKFSATASAQSTRRRTRSTAAGCLRLRAIDRLPVLSSSNIGAPSRPWGLSGPSAYTRRKSGRLRDSTRSTVAPCSTKDRVAMGPAAPDPNSKMLVPVHAGPLDVTGEWAVTGGRGDQPSTGADAGAVGAGRSGATG